MQQIEGLNTDIMDLKKLKNYINNITHDKNANFTLNINENEIKILESNLAFNLVLLKMNKNIDETLYNNILSVFDKFKNNKINEEIILKLKESLSKENYSETRNIFETEIFTIKGGKRKTNKRKTNKRKTNKRKTNKRKTNKRKTNKRKTNKRKTYYGGEGDDEEECPICRVELTDNSNGKSAIIHYPTLSNGEKDMIHPHSAHIECVNTWLKQPGAIKSNSFACPQCSALLKPEDIVDETLRKSFLDRLNPYNELNDEQIMAAFAEQGEVLLRIQQVARDIDRPGQDISNSKLLFAILLLAVYYVFIF